MTTSPHFNNYSRYQNGEQLLLEDLLNELVFLAGMDIYYIARDSESEINLILGEDPTSYFERYWKMEVFLNNTEGWSQGSSFFSKFGLQINKQTNIVMTKRTFGREISEFSRPREGDLIWIPIFNKLFEIKFVEEEVNFHTHGRQKPYYWELQLEMFKYSQENFETGFDEIDEIEKLHSYVIALTMENGTGNYFIGETVTQVANAENVTANVHSWDYSNNKLYVYDISGTFENGKPVIGVESSVSWNVAIYDSQENHEDHRFYTNSEIENSANANFERGESSPFGDPWRT